MKIFRCLVPPVTIDVDPSVQLRMCPFDLGRLELKVGNRPRSSGRVAHDGDLTGPNGEYRGDHLASNARPGR